MTLLPFAQQLDALYKRSASAGPVELLADVEEVSPFDGADPWDGLVSLGTLQQMQLCSGSSVQLCRDLQQDRARLVSLRHNPTQPSSRDPMRVGISPLLAFNLGMPLALEALLGDAPAAPVQLRADPVAAAPSESLPPPATASFAKFAKVGAPHINHLGAPPAASLAGGVAGLEDGAAQQWSDEEAAVLQAVQLFFRARKRCAGWAAPPGQAAAPPAAGPPAARRKGASSGGAQVMS
jgi:hypothetical protein